MLALVSSVPIVVFAANGTVILLGLCAAALPGFRHLWPEIKRIMLSPPGLALLGLCLWAGISAFWSFDPVASAAKSGRLVGLWLAGIAAVAAAHQLPDRYAPRVPGAIPLAVCLAILFYWVELATGGAVVSAIKGIHADGFTQFDDPLQREAYRHLIAFNQIGRGAVLIAIFIWPVVGLTQYVTGGTWLSISLTGAALATILYLPVGAAPLGFLAGAGGFALTLCSPRYGSRIIACVAALALILFPLSAFWVDRPEAVGVEKRSIPVSWQHRIEIWHFAAERIAEKPISGWGFDASRNMDSSGTQFVAELPDGSDIVYPGVTLLPLHPHNGILQIWLELGLPGALLGAIFLLGLGRAISHMHTGRVSRASAAGAFASAFSFACVSFGLWQSWWQASFWLTVMLVALATKSRRPERAVCSSAEDRLK